MSPRKRIRSSGPNGQDSVPEGTAVVDPVRQDLQDIVDRVPKGDRERGREGIRAGTRVGIREYIAETPTVVLSERDRAARPAATSREIPMHGVVVVRVEFQQDRGGNREGTGPVVIPGAVPAADARAGLHQGEPVADRSVIQVDGQETALADLPADGPADLPAEDREVSQAIVRRVIPVLVPGVPPGDLRVADPAIVLPEDSPKETAAESPAAVHLVRAVRGMPVLNWSPPWCVVR